MVTLTPIRSLSNFAPRALAVFDLDGTVAPNTGYLFWRHVWTNHLSSIFTGPYNFVNTVQWLTNPKAMRKRLEAIRETSSFEALSRDFAQTDVGKDIFTRSAEEIAWRRANLQTVIVITGGFDAFAEPVFSRLRADRVHSNAKFVPMAVHGEKKPVILRDRYFNDQAGFVPQAVFTDSHSDRYMVEAFDWPEVTLVRPDRKFRAIRKDHWNIWDSPELSNTAFPEAVRDYAASVIKGPLGHQRALNFYGRWEGRLRSNAEPTPEEQINALAVAGLYLKEEEPLRLAILEAVGVRFENRCTGLYARRIAKNPESMTPLKA